MRSIRIALGTLGVAAIGYALLGALGDPDITRVRHVGFLATVLIAHDGLLMPALIATGVLIHRVVPPPHRAVLYAALAATAAVTVVALPLVLGYGRIADNPSALPRNYAHGLLVILTLIWLAATVMLLSRGRRRRVPPRR